MERIIALVVGVVFVVGGAILAKAAYDKDLENIFEAVLFGLMGVCFGLFLCYVAVFGPPG